MAGRSGHCLPADGAPVTWLWWLFSAVAVVMMGEVERSPKLEMCEDGQISVLSKEDNHQLPCLSNFIATTYEVRHKLRRQQLLLRLDCSLAKLHSRLHRIPETLWVTELSYESIFLCCA